MLEFFTDLIAHYGYAIVVVTILLECAGIPMPGETSLVVAAAFAGTGELNIFIVIIAASLAAIAGDAGGYWIGRYFGRNLITRFGKWIHLTEDRMKIIQGYFDRHGAKTVYFGRFFTILRTYSALFAGICKMPYTTFTLYNALGGITWATVFGILGYVFGHNLPLLEKVARTIGWALTIPLIIVVAIMFGWRWVLKHHEQLALKITTSFNNSGFQRWKMEHSFRIHWLLRQWKARYYIMVQLAVGFFVTAVPVVLFGRLLFDPLAQGVISAFDQEVVRLFTGWATPFATRFFSVFSNLSATSMIIFSVMATIVFALKGRNVQLAVWLVGLIGSQVLAILVKWSVARPRPLTELLPFVVDFGYSFPSGQSLSATVLFGLLSYFLVLAPGTLFYRTGIIITALIVVGFIGFSRIYLGINFLSDVIGGYLVGIAWLATCISAAELYRRGKVGDRRGAKRKKDSGFEGE